MILADKILVTLYNSKKYSSTLLTQLIAQEKIGEDTCELENKFILLGEWIRILQKYYDTSFDTQGNVITPDYPCLAQNQALQLVANLKLAIGNNRYPVTNIFQLGIWIGQWNDVPFYWNDSSINRWWDFPPLT